MYLWRHTTACGDSKPSHVLRVRGILCDVRAVSECVCVKVWECEECDQCEVFGGCTCECEGVESKAELKTVAEAITEYYKENYIPSYVHTIWYAQVCIQKESWARLYHTIGFSQRPTNRQWNTNTEVSLQLDNSKQLQQTDCWCVRQYINCVPVTWPKQLRI